MIIVDNHCILAQNSNIGAKFSKFGAKISYCGFAGSFVKAAFPFCRRKTTRVTDIMQLIHPEVTLSFKSILTFGNSLFVFKMKQINRMAGGMDRINNSGKLKTVTLKGIV
jgi:hypothetical protein